LLSITTTFTTGVIGDTEPEKRFKRPRRVKRGDESETTKTNSQNGYTRRSVVMIARTHVKN
jgi:hypothetical protein